MNIYFGMWDIMNRNTAGLHRISLLFFMFAAFPVLVRVTKLQWEVAWH